MPTLQEKSSKRIARRSEGSRLRIIVGSDSLYDQGLTLYEARPDKKWSTDCISFVVMTEEGLSDALTGDRHFDQTGFKAPLV